MLGRETCLRVLKRVVHESPADQTEVLLLTEDSSLTRFTQSTIHQHVAERNETVILRVVSNKRIAVVTTNILTPSSLRNSLKKAISLAQVQQPNEEFKSLPEPRPIPEVDTYSDKINRLTPDKKGKTVRNLFSISKGK